MHPVDLLILALYIIGMLGMGAWFMRRNRGTDDYYVGGRQMGSLHVGLSVVATDVGGGFSIGLGGLGFAIGISGSWMLFTGLVGAWLAAVLLIPRIKRSDDLSRGMTFPDLLGARYGRSVALVAAAISAVGYLGFTASQILAGAKLAAGVFPEVGIDTALLVMGVVAVCYTVMGGIKAVIYTDTVQWLLLLTGLTLIGIPVSWQVVGGWQGIRAAVGPEMLSLANVGWRDLVNWGITIIPIWFVGMTLYQRIHACRDERSARRAWYIAGLFEWPVMALMGATLGLLARVAAEQGLLAMPGGLPPAAADPEVGLPLLLRHVLPVGLLGLMMAAYFSAILSTADSCLMASSGNVVLDIWGRLRRSQPSDRFLLRFSQAVTLGLGGLALLLAMSMDSVLDMMLHSYAFMVSGLLVPALGALFWKRGTPRAALAAMLAGGGTTVALELSGIALPLELNANLFGLAVSALVFVSLSLRA